MSIEVLRQLAATPLPKSFTHAKDVDAVRSLRRDGLVLAMLDEPPERAARVLAITEKGHAEIMRFHYPDPIKDARTKGSWLQLAAIRARSIIHKMAGTRRDHP